MFKSYCVAMTNRGYRVFPAEAFEHFWHMRSTAWATSWATLIESEQDEQVFLQLRGDLAWCVKSAMRWGYGKV